jgi:hypothetical protein
VGFDPTRPLRATDAKQLLRQVLKKGIIDFTDHALEELTKDNMTTVDAVNVLRAGAVQEAEWENGAWRYRSETSRSCIVFEIESEELCLVVTGWRFKP